MWTALRLTGTLRDFGCVSSCHLSNEIAQRHHDLEERRSLSLQEHVVASVSWKKISDVVRNHGALKNVDVENELKQLLSSAKAIIGIDSSSCVVESAAAFLFNLFKDADRVRQVEALSLREMFGPYPMSQADRACQAVGRLVSTLADEDMTTLTPIAHQNNNDGDGEGKHEFGAGIKFNIDVWPGSDESFLSDSEEEGVPAKEFNLLYAGPKKNELGHGSQRQESGLRDGQDAVVGSFWLQKQVTNYFGSGDSILGPTLVDICLSVTDVLTSLHSDEVLQNELFELLGFDRFELIHLLLENRMAFTKTVAREAASEAILRNPCLKGEGRRPTYCCQVTVQSEEERQLRKFIRREDKRSGKKESRGEDMPLSPTVFDPESMRIAREAALLQAKSKPLLASNGTRCPPAARYPFVFDAYAEAKQSSALIGGSKVLLPAGFERKDNKLYEEVNIPPCSIAKADSCVLVSIDSLDKVAQMAFAGTKTLNRVQSVVFNSAYNSNENLLVCAPTGAGKTNIAMLAVLHELNQHIEHGVLKTTDFKIVYVAPMKALAAEMVRNFGARLSGLGILVRELTGDMSLTKQEMIKTQMLVTTPEKWDVVTRKSTGEIALAKMVKLLIIDEVHLLHDDRGPVIETLVARTLRQVETSQSMIRIVGLSATLPNYLDVARFLNVNPYSGLFFFDGRFRPVPLSLTFIGVKATNKLNQLRDMNQVCYDKVLQQVQAGHQVMVFVHARNETVRTAMLFRDMAKNGGQTSAFLPTQGPRYGDALKCVLRSRNKQLKEVFADGFAMHHAGMLRHDRNVVEKYFSDGHIKVLCCTATLAWGVNLPAHAVIIKGTQVYNAKHGTFVDLGILDVMQIFGRAGRPQFDTFGHGIIITTHCQLSRYLSLMMRQTPIESQFTDSLTDNLNAEISLGTVTNVAEAVGWLRYTYLFVRMLANPLAYGVRPGSLQEDGELEGHRRDLIVCASRKLDEAHMVRYEEKNGFLYPTDLGRIASLFYIKYATVEVINEKFKSFMSEDGVLALVSHAQEFDQIKVREDEMDELECLQHSSCQVVVAGGKENSHGKVNIMLQTYISRTSVDSFSLVSDMAYIAQNAMRIMRALFEIALRNSWPLMARRLLEQCKSFDKRLWGFEHPLRQFSILSPEILHKLEHRQLSVDKLRDMEAKEIGDQPWLVRYQDKAHNPGKLHIAFIRLYDQQVLPMKLRLELHPICLLQLGHMVNHVSMGSTIKHCASQLPCLELNATIQPITRSVLRVRLEITAVFKWEEKISGSTEPFWIWVEDPHTNRIYHYEYCLLHRKQVLSEEPLVLIFTIPIMEPLPPQYYVQAVSDRWLGSTATCALSFQHLILPERHPPHTELLDLQPLPVSALGSAKLETLYRFSYFNPVQTQIFHALYHTDCNVLLGAPTGSGKTVAAELAIFRVFREYPKHKAVYIAPLKALVRERMEDWKVRIEQQLGKKVVELTGDVTPDMRAVANADLIVTTPEKWDGVSRSWQTRSYVKSIALLVIDEIHLLGNERGPVLEVIVSRTNFISSHTAMKVRVVGLSTALANARDLADWLGIKEMGVFNFRPSVRPVPLEVHIKGFPGQHYCPRMATMNKPAFQDIRSHSPSKPVLVFVSSRRQTRLTALDLVAMLALEGNPKQWLHMPEAEVENLIRGIHDSNLKLTLAFGIGIHHAGLMEGDRKAVEELFVNQLIQVLIATSTLAWGVNFPAHLVIIKGTEYYDGKTRRYVDFPVTDVLQMMGRAGRPQFDESGVACIYVQDLKKHFYKKFLYEPFPVESNLLEVLPDHMNAEIVAGTIGSKQDAIDYVTWTYFFRRLLVNPSYYHLESTEFDQINRYLSSLVEKCLSQLASSYCVEVAEDNMEVCPLTAGRIASYYYISNLSVQTFTNTLKPVSTVPDILDVLSNAQEFAQLPVRHNEDATNSELAGKLRLAVSQHKMDRPQTKTHLLLQAHFSRLALPCTDYYTDTKLVLDQVIRVLQAMLDLCADNGWLVSTVQVVTLLQMVVQGRWWDDSPLLCLPHVLHHHLACFSKGKKTTCLTDVVSLPELMGVCERRRGSLHGMLGKELPGSHLDEIQHVLDHLPVVEVTVEIRGWWEDRKEEGVRSVPLYFDGGHRPVRKWLPLPANQEYVLIVHLHQLNRVKDGKQGRKAHAPAFPKSKEEGWVLIVGDIENRDVVVLKRVPALRGRSTTISLTILTPSKLGRIIYTIYLLSDCYLGLDQQFDLCLDVQPTMCVSQMSTNHGEECPVGEVVKTLVESR